MKQGKIFTSTEKPTDGFIFRREGYCIFISYIDSSSINKLDNDSYEYRKYDYYGAITSYEDLVRKCILLKYYVEDELSLMAKAMEDKNNDQYIKYREFVSLCKDNCKASYTSLGLTKTEE